MQLFLSYSREDDADAARVEKHLVGLNHEVWRDKGKLCGGDEWWPKICAEIRDCEVFLFLVTHQSLESKICRKEYEYASRLRKRILPIFCQTVKSGLLWPELVRLQYIDYWSSENPAIDLFKSINNLPRAVPLP